jgi:hypothetical protein
MRAVLGKKMDHQWLFDVPSEASDRQMNLTIPFVQTMLLERISRALEHDLLIRTEMVMDIRSSGCH